MLPADLLAARRPLFFHAHPDDETLATGGLMSLLARRGAQVTLITATRGERGDVVPGPLSALQGTHELVAWRERELAAALAALASEAAHPIAHHWLGTSPARIAGQSPCHYRDSGMRWDEKGEAVPVEDAAADSFTRADRAAEIADLAAALREGRHDLVVSYGPLGGYGHPDHRRAAEVARAAAAECEVPYVAVLSDAEVDLQQPGPSPTVREIDVREAAGALADALRAHASQLTVQGFVDAAGHPATDGGSAVALSLVHCGGQRELRRLNEYYR